MMEPLFRVLYDCRWNLGHLKYFTPSSFGLLHRNGVRYGRVRGSKWPF
jgi:hypothetical protein